MTSSRLVLDEYEWRQVAAQLEDRELEIVALRREGYGAKRVADALGVCESRGRELMRRAERRVNVILRGYE